jgi:ribosome-binding factor A
VQERGRDLRVGDFVRDEIASIIQKQMRDPRVGMVMVNEVSVSRDLSWADVYITSMDAQTEEERTELIGILNKASGYFRTELAKRHKMRTLIDSALQADGPDSEAVNPDNDENG